MGYAYFVCIVCQFLKINGVFMGSLNRFLRFNKISFWRYVILKGVIVWGGGMFLFFLVSK